MTGVQSDPSNVANAGPRKFNLMAAPGFLQALVFDAVGVISAVILVLNGYFVWAVAVFIACGALFFFMLFRAIAAHKRDSGS